MTDIDSFFNPTLRGRLHDTTLQRYVDDPAPRALYGPTRYRSLGERVLALFGHAPWRRISGSLAIRGRGPQLLPMRFHAGFMRAKSGRVFATTAATVQ